MVNFEAIIGIEVHTVVNSKTKMFSNSPNSHTGEPNTLLAPYDLALPGIMPQPNRQVVFKALQLAKALNMQEVDPCVRFDRKNYFYQDLPKGFQITQQYHPIAQHGSIKLSNDRQITIQRFHIEEDTAKQINEDGSIYLDYNRSGIPLIEIVTDPVFRSADEVKQYLTKLRQILLALRISDAKMEEGSLRADLNISVRPIGSTKFGTKVEVKNVNSINNAGKAINYEINRQIGQILLGHSIMQETRRYDDKTQTTIHMREKTNAIDYRYMTEPNILAINLSSSFQNEAISSMPMLPEKLEEFYRSKNVDPDFIQLLLDNPKYQDYLEYVSKSVNNNYEQVSKWLFIELNGLTKKYPELDFDNLSTNLLNELIVLLTKLNNQEINGKQAKSLLENLVIKKDSTVEQLIKELNYVQITDENVLGQIIDKILSTMPNVKQEYIEREQRVLKLVIGLTMKETNGQANPKIVTDILIKKLS